MKTIEYKVTVAYDEEKPDHIEVQASAEINGVRTESAILLLTSRSDVKVSAEAALRNVMDRTFYVGST